jgi:hypothetical protein
MHVEPFVGHFSNHIIVFLDEEEMLVVDAMRH